jgi:transcriptional regulator with XRE-family HTH domain
MPRRIYPSLDAFFKFEGNHGTATRLAEELEINPSYLSLIRSGRRMPALDLALKISRRCHVPIESLIPREKAS